MDIQKVKIRIVACLLTGSLLLCCELVQFKTLNICALSSTLYIYQLQHPHLIVRSLNCSHKHNEAHTHMQTECFHPFFTFCLIHSIGGQFGWLQSLIESISCLFRMHIFDWLSGIISNASIRKNHLSSQIKLYSGFSNQTLNGMKSRAGALKHFFFAFLLV